MIDLLQVIGLKPDSFKESGCSGNLQLTLKRTSLKLKVVSCIEEVGWSLKVVFQQELQNSQLEKNPKKIFITSHRSLREITETVQEVK